MCGIVGIVQKNISNIPYEEILHDLSHRGPDGQGTFSDNNIWLGHRRLAIIDLSTNANQPMFSEDKVWVIVYNGELYNHLELRTELESKGFHFKTKSDTETILNAYIQWGKAAFKMLNGIFAFAIYNTQTKELIIARDAMGVKPLYYGTSNGSFAFGSEIKSILKLQENNREINPDAFFQSLILQYNIDENTGFRSIKKLLPGHYISLKTDFPERYISTKWKSIYYTGSYKIATEKELIDELDNTLNKAVQSQLLSDKPIAYFLSGGLDSSLICAIAQQYSNNKKLRTYCIDSQNLMNKEGFGDDATFAKLLANQKSFELNFITAQNNWLTNLDKMVWNLEEPQADIAAIYVGQIAKAASEDGFQVMMSGTGADDIFSGYRRHQAIQFEKYLHNIPPFFQKKIAALAQILPLNNRTRRIKKMGLLLHNNSNQRMFQYYYWAQPLDVANLFHKNFQHQINVNCIEQYFEKYLQQLPNKEARLNKMLHLEQQAFLPCHNLNYTDKMGMAYSVEIRVPYLDENLIKNAAALDPKFKTKGLQSKYLLKKVAERYLPKELIYRNKTGFGAPLRQWICQDPITQQQIRARLLDNAFISKGYFEKSAIENLITNSINQKQDGAYTLLSLLCIESWLRQFENC